MKTLAINSSMMGQESVTKQLMDYFLKENTSIICYRDLSNEGLAHLSSENKGNNTIDSATPKETAYQINLSRAYLDEFLDADQIVIAAPMYNFSLPSVLKAWIDRIVVAGTTFKYTENGPIGLVKNKKVYILSSRGSHYETEPNRKAMDHQENYLLTVFNFLGITDVTTIRAEGVNMGEEQRQNALTNAFIQIDNILNKQ